MFSVTPVSSLIISLLIGGGMVSPVLAQVRPETLVPPPMPLPPAQPLSPQPPLPLNNPAPVPSPLPASLPLPDPTTVPPETSLSVPLPIAMPAGGLNPMPGTPAIQPATYTLGVGDRIFVGVMNVPEYSAEYQIQVDGTINLPVIGNVSVWGMTLQQVAQDITRRYTEPDVLRNPSITVQLLVASPLHIVVSGQVSRPGAYLLGMEDGKLPTLTQAIRQAGGMTQLADVRQVQVIRPQRSGTDQVLQANLWELLQFGDVRQDITLRNGDSVVLPTAAAINPTEAMLLGSANLSPDAMQISVLGEVGQPGTMQILPNTSLNQVLLAAGGFNSRARKGSVELIRFNSNGTVTRRRIDIDLSSDVHDINADTNPILTHRDVIVVGRSTLSRIGDTLGTVITPIGRALSLFDLLNTLFPQQQQSP